MLKSLDRKSPLPLYSQIKEQLLTLIQEMAGQPAEKGPHKLYPEETLTEMFGVSRMTVRQAVQELVAEGLLYRIRGVGTFIKPPHVSGQLQEIERFVEEWSLQGKKIDVVVSAFKIVSAPLEWATRLGLSANAPVLYIQRRRFADGMPVALDDRYLPAEMADIVSPKDVQEESIFLTLARKGKMIIEKADYEITAKAASRKEAALLNLKPGAPLLARKLVIFAAPRRPVITGLSLYRADLFTYSVSVPSKSGYPEP
ncbi:MAG: GntR family transcriptional regulator [Deltaproteobacteria bacterium]|nr:GntR family transcriptional regulator [Deltaproteobacteria bacterium]MBI4796454.1 GntR family transcriptional regulator [Deltaproteobacteria bacterium]